MQIYNFFNGNGSAIGIIVAIIPIICLIVTISLIVHYIKGKKRNAVLLYKLISMAPIIIMLSITILFLILAFRVGRLFMPALIGKGKIVVGEMTQVEATSYDARDGVRYDISFKVDDFEFDETDNTYSESEMAGILKNQGRQVKVTYTEQNGSCVVTWNSNCSSENVFFREKILSLFINSGVCKYLFDMGALSGRNFCGG